MAKYEIERRGVRWAIYNDEGKKVFSHWDKHIVEQQLERLNKKHEAQTKS